MREIDIYRDQLERNSTGRGCRTRSDRYPEEAGAARTEVARRLIRADAASGTAQRSDPRWRNAAALAVVVMPLLAVGLYLVIGSPNLPDDPLSKRLAASPDKQDIAIQIAGIEQHLAQSPNDGNGWEIIAPSGLQRCDAP